LAQVAQVATLLHLEATAFLAQLHLLAVVEVVVELLMTIVLAEAVVLAVVAVRATQI
jgi:hypothetical protein